MVAKRKTSNLPVSIKEQLAAEAADIGSKIAAPSGDRISLSNSGTIRTPDGGEGNEIEVVVIDFIASNMFYPDAYDRDNPQPPSCFALGREPSLLAPSKNADPAEAATCSVCPNNQFGSALVGAGKACKNTRLLAVVDISSDDPEIWVLAVSPTALKKFDGYVRNLANKHTTVPVAVLTRIALDPTADFASPSFDIERLLEDDELEKAFGLRDAAMERLMTEPDTSNKTPTKPAAKKRATRKPRR